MQPTPFDRLKIRALIAEAEYSLATGPHPERARRDAETLLLHVLRRENPATNHAWLIAHQDECLSSEAAARLRALVKRRRAGEPIQYITGETEFCGLPFHVNRNVLIPRLETEHPVEKAIALAAGLVRPRILDVGTGSGAIAIALAANLPAARIIATDISAPALDVARRNAERHRVAGRVQFLEGDLLAPVAGQQFDLIVSNPPYVPETDRDSLSVEVRDFEPAQALFAGGDGLAIYRRLLPAAFDALVHGGFVLLEIGYGQQTTVSVLLAEAGFKDAEFTPDLQGIPRVVSAQRP
jgi:release factor glutamine methyltransferase